MDWEVVELGEILDVQTGNMNAQDQVNNGKYPFFTGSINIQQRISKLVSTFVGSTVQSLRKPIIQNLKIPLPPLTQQKKIAKILSTSDQKRAIPNLKKRVNAEAFDGGDWGLILFNPINNRL